MLKSTMAIFILNGWPHRKSLAYRALLCSWSSLVDVPDSGCLGNPLMYSTVKSLAPIGRCFSWIKFLQYFLLTCPFARHHCKLLSVVAILLQILDSFRHLGVNQCLSVKVWEELMCPYMSPRCSADFNIMLRWQGMVEEMQHSTRNISQCASPCRFIILAVITQLHLSHTLPSWH